MRTLRRESAARLALRAVVLLAPLLALQLDRPDAPPGAGVALLVLVLSAGAAALPESPFPAVAFVVVAVWWAVAAHDEVPVGAVPAALLLLAAHLAAVLLSYGPAALPLGRRLVVTWLRRGLLLAAAVPVLWLLARVVEDQPEPPGIWVSGLASAVAVCLVAAAALGRREEP